jgi:hypothetical protein
MENHDNNLKSIIRTATNEVLVERGLSERWRVYDVHPEIDSDCFVVGLAEKVQPGEHPKYPSFRIDAAEIIQQPRGETVEGVKPLVDRELSKLFPERARR